ncbi:MAG: hypothetical protein ACYSUV_04835 [Planctomycetota bacterium]|jgi:transposase-like protein
MVKVYILIGWGALLGLVLVYKYARPKRKCPYCGSELARWRVPETSKQVYWGGWTCANCGKQVNVTFWGQPKK